MLNSCIKAIENKLKRKKEMSLKGVKIWSAQEPSLRIGIATKTLTELIPKIRSKFNINVSIRITVCWERISL